jgi:hypothetical protein
MLLNSTYGKVGMLAYPCFFFLEMLGPLIELLGYVSFTVTVLSGRADWLFVAAFLSVAVVLGGAYSTVRRRQTRGTTTRRGFTTRDRGSVA